MTHRRALRPTLALAVVAAAGSLSACGAGDGSSPAAAAAPTAKTTKTIDMGDLFFAPQRATVARGTKVTFANKGQITHNAKGEGFFSETVEPGDGYSHTFDEAGTFAYVCTFHAGMNGVLVVE